MSHSLDIFSAEQCRRQYVCNSLFTFLAIHIKAESFLNLVLQGQQN